MRYQSIIRFFEYAHIDATIPETFNVARAKKTVQAEFAMEPDGIITIDHFSYTKQDILSELDRPDFLQRLDHHKHIWQNPSLLDLLEKDKVNLTQQPTWFYLGYAPRFNAFVSDYFAGVFDRIMRSLLSTHNLYNAAIWLNYIAFIDTDHEEEAFRSTRLYMDESVRFFKNLNDESYKTRDVELSTWYNTNWSAFINKLPDSMLGYVDELISAIINFTVRIQKSNREMCLKISNEMLLVTNANFALKQLIQSNHQSYKQSYQKRTVKGYFSNVNYVYVVIVVLFWVARFAMNSNSSYEKDITTNFPAANFNPQPMVSTTTITEGTIPDANNQPFIAQRQEYATRYLEQTKIGFHMLDTATLRTLPFEAKRMYLMVEGHNSGKNNLDTIGIENITDKTITADIMWSGNVYHHTLKPNGYVGFAAAPDKNLDIMLSFGSATDSTVAFSKSLSKDQYIHLRGNNEAPFIDITDEFSSPNEMPYLLHSELRTLPVYVKINQRNDSVYFDVQSKGSILNAHSNFR